MQGEGAARGPPPAYLYRFPFLPIEIKGGIGSPLPSVDYSSSSFFISALSSSDIIV